MSTIGVVIVSCCVAAAAGRSGVSRPDNKAVLAGTTVVFDCTSSANNQTRSACAMILT